MAALNTVDQDDSTEPEVSQLSSEDHALNEVSVEKAPAGTIDRYSIDHHSNSSQDGDLELAQTKSIAQAMSPTREFLFVGLLCSTQLVTQASLMNTLNIIHVIGSDLGITDEGVLSWLIAGYSLTIGTFILLSGRAGDLFGYKLMVTNGFIWFAIWNVAAGCSVYSKKNGQILFIISRVLAGIGPAILLPNALGLLGSTYKAGPKKNMIFSLFGACSPGGAVIGGTFAGLWSLLWWPWTFWTFGVALAILASLSVFILPSVAPEPRVQNMSLKQRLQELDMMGAMLGIVAMILFNFAWNQAPGFGWRQSYIYVLLIIGIVLFPVFIWVELKVAPNPLVPFKALTKDVIFVMVCEACGWASFGIFIYYYIQFLQRFRHTSPLLTMAQLSPVAISGAAASITTGHIISRIGPEWVMFISMVAFLAGNVITATIPVHQSYFAQTFIVALIIPWGMDMSFPAGTLIMSDAVEKKHQGMAASLVSTIVNYSISIGVGVAGTVETQSNNGGHNEKDVLKGYRAAMYLGIGFSVFGVLTSGLFLLKTFLPKADRESNKVGRNDRSLR